LTPNKILFFFISLTFFFTILYSLKIISYIHLIVMCILQQNKNSSRSGIRSLLKLYSLATKIFPLRPDIC
jgi:hypothetical protein